MGENEGLNSQPFFQTSKLRHVCLTDDPKLRSDHWEIVLVDRIIPDDCHRSQRYFKTRPHIIFPNYKYSLYLDNTVVLKRKTEDFLRMIFQNKSISVNDPFFYLPYHSQFNLINEFNACANNELDDQVRIYEQLNDYIKTNLNALKKRAYWGAILLRNHNHIKLVKFSEIWFSHICRYSRRDQLSIIHAALQAKISLNGFELENGGSDYHKWPITRKKRNNRTHKTNYIDHIPHNYLEVISNKILENKNLLMKLENKKDRNNLLMILNFKEFYKNLKYLIKNFLNQ